MTLTLLLPWFPILLAVGVGGRLLGRNRGLFMGILCALFWVMLIQASVGVGIWGDPWAVVTIVAGCVAIAAMGRWSAVSTHGHALPSPAEKSVPGDHPGLGTTADAHLQHVAGAIDQFDSWLGQHRDLSDPWPQFGEFIRATLYQCCKATHVRPYRVLGDEQQLLPLREPDPLVDDGRVSARRGIIGHVMTTGRTYVSTDGTSGELVARLAGEAAEQMAWCFAVRHGTRRVGGVVVGHVEWSPDLTREYLHTVERLLNLFWGRLIDALECRVAVQVDPGSGLFERTAFLRVAGESVRESYALGEPVACAVFALEGLREINDSGRWEVADDLVRQVADTLRCKIRTDDRIGRFDGSRIVLLLRRVDSELASLIVSQMMVRLAALRMGGADDSPGAPSQGPAVTIRCGVSGSGTDRVDLRLLISRALAQCRRARLSNTSIASDLTADERKEGDRLRGAPEGALVGAASTTGDVSPS